MEDRNEFYMRRCLQLAQNGMQGTPPNPMVGAVIVCDGKIIGEGYHVHCGEGHAEVNAVASVKDNALLHRSTLYVSLEPCSHYGKTPPCADLIISCGIPRVVVGCIDPFAQVSGRGIQKLRQAGIDVTVGVLEDECKALNKRFITYNTHQRPFVTLKWAETADGFIDRQRTTASGAKPLHISTTLTQMLAHRLRAESQAVMVGCRTALLDNPSLNVRSWEGRNPLRVVTDRHGSLPASLNLFDGSAPTLVFTENRMAAYRQCKAVELIIPDYSQNLLTQILWALYQHGIQTLLVEGGRLTTQAFIDADLWDEAYVEKGTMLIGEGVEAPHFPSGTPVSQYVRLSAAYRHYWRKHAETSPHDESSPSQPNESCQV
jgi:diaminohydroxyphosphoribosylaminopyrimidine deaminase/5-amino-6-(5-phosphoribosylamino)uracil reductase